MAYAEFSKRKYQFFLACKEQPQPNYNTFEDFHYAYLTENLKLIRTEFEHLFDVLKNDVSITDRAYYAYCYHCALMLQTYHKAYSQDEKAKDYAKAAQEIKAYFLNQKDHLNAKRQGTYFNQIEEKIKKGVAELLDITQHIAKARTTVGLLNVNRIYWIFCRLSLTQSFLLLKDSQFLNAFDRFFNQTSDIEKMIKRLNYPNSFLLYASVGLFVTRFMMHTAMLIKHTLMPNEKENEASTTQRFIFEINKRQYDYLNDLVWGSVNTLTNFAPMTGISTAAASWVTAGFMSFDFLMMMYRKRNAHLDYLEKKSQYEQDLDNFKQMKDTTGIHLTHIALIKLDIEWNATKETLHFNAAAALLVMSGFTASLMLTNPALIGLCYMQGLIGVSMYLTGDDFGRLRQKIGLSQSSLSTDKAIEEAELEKSNFASIFAKQVLVPPLTIMAYSLSWPLALSASLAYVAYQAYESLPQSESSLAL